MPDPYRRKKGDMSFKTVIVLILSAVLFLLALLAMNKMKNALT